MRIALKSQYLLSKGDTFLKNGDAYMYMLAILRCACREGQHVYVDDTNMYM